MATLLKGILIKQKETSWIGSLAGQYLAQGLAAASRMTAGPGRLRFVARQEYPSLQTYKKGGRGPHLIPWQLGISLHEYSVWGIYEIDMHNLYPNVSSTFNVGNKRVKYSLDSSYLLHCRLRHINKKRLDKLQHDGILQSTHEESLEKCYPKETMRYYFYYPLKNKIFVAQNAEFFEDNLIVQEASVSYGPLIMSGSDKGVKLIQEEDTQPSKNTSKEHNEVVPIEVEPPNVKVPIRRSVKIPQAPDRYGFYVDVDEYDIGDLNEPPNYKVALSDHEYDKWLEAINTEMQSIKDNQVWILVELPPNGQTVRSKWLFKKKTDMDGNVHTFKALLVAKGYTQTYDVDYGETFSSVIDIRAIRILLAITTFYDYEIWQMDFKTTFLNGHLSEDQASRSWNKRFDEEIKKIGFTQNPNEPCVYLKASGSSLAFLVLYVDDILLMGNSVIMLQEVKFWLFKCFSMKDLGEAAYIIRIKIICDRSKWIIALSQSAYLEKILKKFRIENSKKGYTPMMEKPDYRKSQGAKTPSEAHVCKDRFQQNPSEIHWTAMKTILKYLRNTKDMVLMYGAKPEAELKVSCYADASFQTDKDDTKSQMGYVFVLNGGAVDRKSAKQSTTAMSSIEAKYIVAAEASMEAV
ncbi:retrotransposon protein, putative, ty1-copia subclass [Tanacetum coccineum]|uniref:Retrotransposon protein, putative, ty1-copia subclass n=1 Tax=Tanacetum coccineum TaxID=301880 RepID=A0ABQ5FNJ4_9ASTR